jgi:Calcineurin-like phosphoesterase
VRPWTWILGVVLLLAVAGAAALLAEEKIEGVVAPETGALRPPEGEWIRSVQGETADIWAVGDADPPRAASVARLIRRTDPDRILYLGDVYPRGKRDDFRRWAKPFGGLVNRMAPTPGNHDWPEAREGYEPFWREVTGETPPTYYSFTAGGWEILSVNGEHSEQRAVENWLRDRVKSGGDCRIAFWHRPRLTAGRHEGGDHRAEEYWEAIQGRARIIVNGHDHNMQRMRERDGIVEFVSGAGGRHLYSVNENDPRLAFADDTHYGALRLQLSRGTARWRFVSAKGRALKSGVLRCHA